GVPQFGAYRNAWQYRFTGSRWSPLRSPHWCLRDSGRDHGSYDNVAADLAYLAGRGRIARRRRGVFSRPDRIVIRLTAGSLNNNYIAVGNHLGFFPADAVGAANAKDGEGAMLTLHYAGLPEPAETEI